MPEKARLAPYPHTTKLTYFDPQLSTRGELCGCNRSAPRFPPSGEWLTDRLGEKRPI